MSGAVIVGARQALADELHLVDVRDEASYLAAHAPGAVWLDIKAWEHAAKRDDTDLSKAQFWADRIGQLGISNETAVAVYDSGTQTEAARVWFMLQLFGADASIVDGGWPALRGHLAGEEEVAARLPVVQRFQPSAERPRVGLQTRHTLRGHVERGDVQVLDARTSDEFSGEDLRNNRRGGHLPGARHLSHTDLLDAGGILKAPEALRALFDAAGIREGEPVVTHCQGGGRAALAAAAAVQAGFANVQAYYLSFGDWAADDSCPIAR